MMKKFLTVMMLGLIASSIFAFSWESDYAGADVLSVTPVEGTREIEVKLNAVTGKEGADKLLVELFKDSSLRSDKNLGKSKKSERKTTFELSSSGSYSVRVTAIKNNEEKKYTSSIFCFDYSLPLVSPTPDARNIGEGKLEVKWDGIDEAESYTVTVRDYETGAPVSEDVTTDTRIVFSSLEDGRAYTFTVSAVRGNETSSSSPLKKTARNEKDREWQFTFFGQSTKEALNRCEILDSDDLTVKLYAGSRTEQGGKFTSFHDGISFYYTRVDADEENFVLSCTITVDWINPTPDGQEGFGILVLDSIGEKGVSSVNNYTNSVGLIATKFEETVNGVKYSAKDALGARFVTGITPEVLQMGDSGVASYGKSTGHAYSYDTDALVKSGDVYRLTVKKDNTGYHCYYSVPEEEREWVTDENGEYIRAAYPEEFTLYGPENLTQIDKDYVYVGFAAARWAEVTVSDIEFTVTDPETDPPKEEEKAELVPLTTSIKSPSGFWTTDYPFVFNANADGVLTVKESGTSHYYIKNQRIEANTDYRETISLIDTSSRLYILFTPDSSYKPGENATMAQYNEETARYEEDYSDSVTYRSVTVRAIDGDTIYCAPNGFGFNEGTYDSPVDIYSALLYSSPGQTIVLKEGTYNIGKQLVIERGNSGTEEKIKTLRSEDGKRAVLRFSRTAQKGGFVIWGDWWRVENIDITNTPDGSKGLQVAGSYNVISHVNAYSNGDTGIQISGTSSDTFPYWPHDNRIEFCVSHDNCDIAQNNADGFAAKLTCGNGNVFYGCIAYSNIDDGWDLYSKIESGPIGEVLIDSCIAYRNGSLSDGSGSGDGNGFKLGGDGIAVNHRIVNSLSFLNTANGLTSNSNPTLTIENCTLYSNGNRNLTLYGKGSGERSYSVSNLLSVSGTLSDDIKEAGNIGSDDNYFCNGNTGVNLSGERIGKEIFTSTDLSLLPFTIGEDGIETNTFLSQDTPYGAHI